LKNLLFYDVTGFLLNTENDFYRFKLTPARGNQEVFYGNSGKTNRYGVETYFRLTPLSYFTLQASYTYSDFRYTDPDSISGQYLPNSPIHQLYAEAEVKFLKKITLGISTELQTKWYIFTDPANYLISQEGFQLYHTRLSYEWKIGKLKGDLSVFGKNMFDKKFIAFTEPDPDKNSYQPAPGREFFVSLRLKI
jgi:iron complex outermembrane recepter protein